MQSWAANVTQHRTWPAARQRAAPGARSAQRPCGQRCNMPCLGAPNSALCIGRCVQGTAAWCPTQPTGRCAHRCSTHRVAATRGRSNALAPVQHLRCVSDLLKVWSMRENEVLSFELIACGHWRTARGTARRRHGAGRALRPALPPFSNFDVACALGTARRGRPVIATQSLHQYRSCLPQS